MKVDLPKRIVQNIDDTTSVSALAIESLSSRLAAVGKLLPLAIRFSEKDVELVHYLRIWTRRTSAALNLFQPLIPPEEYRVAAKTIKRIRRAANKARDLDVMIIETKAAKKSKLQKQLLKELVRQRKKAQKSIDQVYRKFYRNDRWKKFTRQVVGAIGSEAISLQTESTGDQNDCGHLKSTSSSMIRDLLDSPANAWAATNLREKFDDLLSAQPAVDAKLPELHRFRIKAKQLKYTLELLTPFFPESFCKELTDDLSEIQETLGDYNDIKNAISVLKQHTEDSSGKARKKWENQLSIKKRISQEMRSDLNQKLPLIFQEIKEKLDEYVPLKTSFG